MKKLFTLLVGFAAMFSLSAASAATAETATSQIGIVPQGKTYESQFAPANLSLAADVFPAVPPTTNLAGQPALTPILTTQYNLTKDQRFVPDPKQPVCTSVNEGNANFPPDAAIALCPNSLIGNGTANILLANALIPGGANLLTDPILTVFNAGTDSQGRGVMTIQGYSASTNVGIYMKGVLKEGILQIDVPRLTADSSTTTLAVNLPGELGQTKDYVQTKCSSGKWIVNATLKLGFRDAQDNVSGEQTVNTDAQSIPCQASAGKPKIGKVGVKPIGKTKASSRSRSNVAKAEVSAAKVSKFQVKVKNTGSATAKNVKITPKGAAKGVKRSVSNIAPGKTKKYTVKAVVKGKKGQKVTVKFKVAASKTNSKTGKVKVRLK